MFSGGAAKSKIGKHQKVALGFGVCAVIVATAVLGILIYSNSNSSKHSNTAQALVRAKKTLAANPNNIDDILSVAYLSKTENQSTARQYFSEALTKLKQQNNPDIPGKSAITYWAAAGLARQAGQTNEAKKYYQDVIQTANPVDSYQQSLVKQARAILARLQ